MHHAHWFVAMESPTLESRVVSQACPTSRGATWRGDWRVKNEGLFCEWMPVRPPVPELQVARPHWLRYPDMVGGPSYVMPLLPPLGRSSCASKAQASRLALLRRNLLHSTSRLLFLCFCLILASTASHVPHSFQLEVLFLADEPPWLSPLHGHSIRLRATHRESPQQQQGLGRRVVTSPKPIRAPPVGRILISLPPRQCFDLLNSAK